LKSIGLRHVYIALREYEINNIDKKKHVQIMLVSEHLEQCGW